MFKAFINAFKIKELRNRILFSAAVIVVCRIAANIPCPGVNTQNLRKYFDVVQDTSGAGGFLGMIDLFSGGALQQFAVGALGIMPYISASIIMQLLVPVLPSLERLKREGEAGMNKINQYTRYLTIVICLIQGAMTSLAMMHPERLGLPPAEQPLVSGNTAAFVFFSVIILTCGTMILMWLGEKITDKGIGNGVSIIITIGIIDRLPKAIAQLGDMYQSGSSAGGGHFRLPHVLLLIIIFAVVTALTIILCQGVRKVPIQMARKTVGNKVAGGSTYMPLKVNFPGVMPIIFAGAILMFPPMILRAFAGIAPRIAALQQYFSHESYSYMLMYGLLILAFSYFWVSNMFNPVQIADNLKKEGAYVPGIRPGKPTCDYLDNLMTVITFAGAIYLCALSIFPMLLATWLKIPYTVASFFGGTSLLIIVGVTIDTLSQLESHLVMKNYEGFLQRGRLRSRRG